MPLKRQKSAAEHWYSALASHKVFNSLASAEPWTDLYAPQDLKDVAIHHDKLREVKEACMRIKTRSSCIVVITGPPGCSKSTCLQAVCQSLGFSAPIFWEESESNYRDSEAGDFNGFEEFLFKSTRYSSSSDSSKLDFRQTAVAVKSRPPQLVIIENLPSWVSDKPQCFQNSLRSALSHVLIPTLLAFVLTKSSSNANFGSLHTCTFDNAVLGRLFPPNIVEELGVCRIEFNPIAPTIMTRAINRILNIVSESIEIPLPSKAFIQLLVASSSGDIRLAINNLQFALMAGQTPSAYDTMECTSFGKDTGLVVFHALGKILYSKRLSDSASDCRSFLPAHLQAHKRAPLSFNPESVLDQSGLSGDDVVAWLHENYLSFYTNSDSFDALAVTSTRISWADAHLSGGMNWRLALTPAADRNSGVCLAGSHYAAMVVARSIALQSSENSRGNVNRFRLLKAPKSKSVESQRRNTWDTLRISLFGASGSRFREVMVAGLRSSLLDRFPMELKIPGIWHPGNQYMSPGCSQSDTGEVNGRANQSMANDSCLKTQSYQFYDDATVDNGKIEVEIDEEFSDEEPRW